MRQQGDNGEEEAAAVVFRGVGWVTITSGNWYGRGSEFRHGRWLIRRILFFRLHFFLSCPNLYHIISPHKPFWLAFRVLNLSRYEGVLAR